MAKYVHVGTFTQVYDTPYVLDRLGQTVEMPDSIAALIPHAVLPLAKFEDFGLTADELKRYPSREALKNAPLTIHAKWEAVWAAALAQKTPVVEE